MVNDYHVRYPITLRLSYPNPVSFGNTDSVMHDAVVTLQRMLRGYCAHTVYAKRIGIDIVLERERERERERD